MSDHRCLQGGLVEALHDRRLGEPERLSIERHLRSCAECASLRRELDQVSEALRAPALPLDPFTHQRARLALLRSAVGGPTRAGTRRPWAVGAVVLLAGSAWAASSWWSPPRPHVVGPPAVTSSAPAVVHEVPAIGSARGGDPLPGVPPPTAGAVDLREAPPGRGVTAPTGRGSESTRPPSSSPRDRATDAPPGADAREPAPAASVGEPPSASPAAPAVSPASRDFAAAMQALGSGDFGRAASALQMFVTTYPFDARSDDAAYLVAIAFERAGRTGDAKSAAASYLRSRPRGAHRLQAAKMAGVDAAVASPMP